MTGRINALAQKRTTIPIRGSDRCADSILHVRIRVGMGRPVPIRGQAMTPELVPGGPAPRQYSADELFTKFKEQNYIELLHHQMKTPLAVRPVFLKSPRRVEALVTLLQIALQAYQVLERRYRQTVPEDAPADEQRMTAETLLRHFRVCGCIVTWYLVGLQGDLQQGYQSFHPEIGRAHV